MENLEIVENIKTEIIDEDVSVQSEIPLLENIKSEKEDVLIAIGDSVFIKTEISDDFEVCKSQEFEEPVDENLENELEDPLRLNKTIKTKRKGQEQCENKDQNFFIKSEVKEEFESCELTEFQNTVDGNESLTLDSRLTSSVNTKSKAADNVESFFKTQDHKVSVKTETVDLGVCESSETERSPTGSKSVKERYLTQGERERIFQNASGSKNVHSSDADNLKEARIILERVDKHYLQKNLGKFIVKKKEPLANKSRIEKNAVKQIYPKNSQDSLNNLITVYENTKIYNCEICKKSFWTKAYLKLHLNTHFGGNKYTCKICKKVLGRRQSLIAHMFLHPDKKNYTCNVCFTHFDSAYNLKRHTEKLHIYSLQTHYKCHLCQFISSSRNVLEAHVRNDHRRKEKPFKCEFCDKRFQNKKYFNSHVAAHSGIGVVYCEFCPMSFAHNNSLKNHMMTHTKLYPYKCEKCDKGFPRISKYKLHLLRHERE